MHIVHTLQIGLADLAARGTGLSQMHIYIKWITGAPGIQNKVARCCSLSFVDLRRWLIFRCAVAYWVGRGAIA